MRQLPYRTAARRSVRGLEAVGANVLGTIMNNVQGGKSGYYGYGGYAYGGE